ncbi:hypothetical protein [Flaviflexus equikiangi]|uniref:hypothetical protein n=1 Tax=Flaviflexus equikiangi TaxID=2758573 RepID=UPI0015F395D9|nr:hypothetical protein [Flaviflexus equikiangi]
MSELSEQPNFDNEQSAFDDDRSIEDCVLTEDGHSLTPERFHVAHLGAWQPVLLCRAIGHYVEFLTQDGYRRYWTHDSHGMTAFMSTFEETEGARADWSESSKILKVQFGQHLIVAALHDGEITPCKYDFALSEPSAGE